jgi:hypothetical protein
VTSDPAAASREPSASTVTKPSQDRIDSSVSDVFTKASKK